MRESDRIALNISVSSLNLVCSTLWDTENKELREIYDRAIMLWSTARILLDTHGDFRDLRKMEADLAENDISGSGPQLQHGGHEDADSEREAPVKRKTGILL